MMTTSHDTDFLVGPDEMPTTRVHPMAWSVRRELWENRSIYLAPLAVAAVFLCGFVMSTITLPRRTRALLKLDAAHQRAAIVQPYDSVAIVLILTALIVAVFYCLDALHGERRDRSILFWKSLPVSDRITVLSKATIPLLILPAFIFVIVVVAQLAMLLWSSFVLLVNGLSPATTWAHFNVVIQSLVLLYGLIALSLWHAPIFAWLLLISVWARRAALLWAVLPPLAIAGVEKIAFGSTHFASLLKDRVAGFASSAFAFNGKDVTIDSLTQLSPGKFLSSPSLWIGLCFAAICLAAAVRLRRNREPI